MKKLLLVLISTMLIVTSILSVGASYPLKYVKTATINGVNFTYRTIDDKYVEILKGEGFIPEKIDELPVTKIGWKAYALDEYDPEYSYVLDKNWTIPNTVSYIDSGAFEYNSSIETITIPANVLYMGNNAFFGCSKLKSVKISSGLSTISNCAFTSCKRLEKVELSDSICEIGKYAFLNCTNLKSINIPACCSVIWKGAFYNCKALKTFDFSNSLSYGCSICSKGIGLYDNKSVNYYELPKKIENSKKIADLNIICGAGNYETADYALKNNLNLTYNIKNNGNYFGSINAGNTVKITFDGKKPSKLVVNKSQIAKAASTGKITGLKKGTVTVTATMSDGTKHKGTFKVLTSPTIKKKAKNGKYAVVKTVTVNKGKSVSVKIFGKASGVKNKYTNTSIAKVTSKNTATDLSIKGLKKGETTLKIKVNGVELKLKVKVR